MDEELTCMRELVQANENPKVSKLFAEKSNSSHVEQLLFLFAAGVQLTAEATGNNNITINRFFLIDSTGEDYFNAAYCPPDITNYPNSIAMALSWAINFCGMSFSVANKGASQSMHDEFRKMVRKTIGAGAEEAYHAYQHNDPSKRSELEALLIQRYGENWREVGFQEQQRVFASRDQKAINDNSNKHPVEIDTKRFKHSLEKRIDALTSRFFSFGLSI
jgi:hypothetical protein